MKKNKKEKNLVYRAFIVVAILFAVFGILYISYSLYLSNQIRKFDVHLKVLYNEVSVGILEKDGERIRLDENDLAEVCLFPRRFSRTAEKIDDKEPIDSFKVSMVHGSETEVITFERYAADIVYVSVTYDEKTLGYFYKTNSGTDYDTLVDELIN